MDINCSNKCSCWAEFDMDRWEGSSFQACKFRNTKWNNENDLIFASIWFSQVNSELIELQNQTLQNINIFQYIKCTTILYNDFNICFQKFINVIIKCCVFDIRLFVNAHSFIYIYIHQFYRIFNSEFLNEGCYWSGSTQFEF